MNLKRILFGGIAAGIWINAIEYTAHEVILGQRYMALIKMGHYFPEPTIPFMPINIGISLFVGFFLAVLYAASRGSLKPGPLTAIKVGLAVGCIAAIPGNVAAVAWSTVGKLVPFVTCLAILAECIGGTLIAAAIYKSKDGPQNK